MFVVSRDVVPELTVSPLVEVIPAALNVLPIAAVPVVDILPWDSAIRVPVMLLVPEK